MAIALHQIAGWDSGMEREPGFWQFDLKHGHWIVTRKWYAGGSAWYEIDAHSGKIVEVRIGGMGF